MKNQRILLIFSIPLAIIVIAVLLYLQTQNTITQTLMTITSSVFEANQAIPSKYSCDGQDVSPPLTISGVPAETKTLALIVDDPDAPGKTWVHWIVWNIDPQTAEIPESAKNIGVEGTTDFGRTGWGGPCPPSGSHRYFFKLIALDTNLEIESSTDKAGLEKAMEGHIIEQAELVGLYQRQ